MSRKIKILAGLCLFFGATAVFAGGQPATASFNSISRQEVEMLLADVAKVNPDALKRLAEDPELKKQQLENLKQLLAFASQAQKEGLTNDPTNRQELENIRAEIIAVNYDREINKDKGPMPPFGFITDDQVKVFWGTAQRDREAEFQRFIVSKLEILKQGNPEMKDREISEEERTQARDFFAKIEIYEKEFNDKITGGRLSKQFKDKVALQVKLQQAQFLARLYSQKIADKVKVSDEDVARYVAGHPELNPAEKKAKAEKILERAKAGEDFAALANEFSEDPGNKNSEDEPQGGIYQDVPKGKMVAPFEQAALALEPGQVASNVVETDFGYHVIKLEKKGKGSDPDGKPTETYDVRHILISTAYADPANPDGRGVPVKEYVRTKLEEEKEKRILDEIVLSNNIQVPDDFTIPTLTAEKQPAVKKRRPVRKKRSVKKRS